MTGRPAVFLDRDGTLVDDPGFLSDPGRVRLLPDAARALAGLAGAGFALVVVTNQSGIGRGLISEDQYRTVSQRLAELLAAEGVALDGSYHCPHDPGRGPCACRKPGTELYRRAVDDLGLDPGTCWWVGDRITDLLPAADFGGRAVLVRTGEGRDHVSAAAEHGWPSVAGIGDAAAWIGQSTEPGRD